MISPRKFLSSLGTIALSAAVFAGCVTLNREAGFLPIFDGKTLNGWKLLGGKGDGFGGKGGGIGGKGGGFNGGGGFGKGGGRGGGGGWSGGYRD